MILRDEEVSKSRGMRVVNHKRRVFWGWLTAAGVAFGLGVYCLIGERQLYGLIVILNGVVLLQHRTGAREREIGMMIFGKKELTIVRRSGGEEVVDYEKLVEAPFNDFCAEVRFKGLAAGRDKPLLLRRKEFDDRTWARICAELKRIPLQ